MSDTPRTDDLLLSRRQPGRQTATYWRSEYFILAGLTKQLELELRAREADLLALREEIEMMLNFERSVNEALNRGDGVYRP